MNSINKPLKLLVMMAAFLPAISSCNKSAYKDYSFKYWNDSKALNTLKDYVKDVTNSNSKSFIPKIDRIATFDMDGTLYGERAPIYVEWLMYHDYITNKKPELKSKTITMNEAQVGSTTKVNHDVTLEEIDKNVQKFMENRESPKIDSENKWQINLEMREAYGGAELFSGLTIPEYISYVDSFLEKEVTGYFTNLKFKDMFYLPMIEVVEFLQLNEFDVYIVSGTDRFMVRDIVNKHLTIPSNKVIGMDVSLDVGEDGIVRRGNKLMYKNVEKVKVELITQEIGKKPVLSFGNSGGDVEMHDYTLSNETYKHEVFMVNNDDNVREYWQDRSKDWEKHPKYNVFSMKNDWKTIYGDKVTKK